MDPRLREDDGKVAAMTPVQALAQRGHNTQSRSG